MNAKALVEQTGIKPSDLWCRRGGRKKTAANAPRKEARNHGKNTTKGGSCFFSYPLVPW